MKSILSFRDCRGNPRELRLAAAVALLLLAHGTALPQAAPQPVTKEAALRSVVRDVIAPGYQQLAAKCHVLTEAAEALQRAREPEALEKVRHAWVGALLAAREMQWLQSGPIADRESLASFYYSKVLPFRMETVLSSAREIDDSFIAEFGATARGMFALEYLLFEGKGNELNHTNAPAAPASAASSASEWARRNGYILALARDLEARANDLAKDWTAPGEQGAAGKFIAGGQQSLSLLVNELAQFTEQVAEQRLNFILVLPQPISRQLGRIEGSGSGTSQESLVALLEGARKLYREADGSGLEGYVKHLNGPLAERLETQLEAAIGASQAIGAPLEQAVVAHRPSVQSAYDKARALEILFKVDLASALGVTLTFSSNDGD